MLDLNKLSTENLKRTQKILKILLDELEIQGGVSHLVGNKIPLKIFEREGFCCDEVEAILDRLDGVEVRNYELEKYFEEYEKNRIRFPSESELESLTEIRRYDIWGIKKDDLDKYLILRIKKIEEVKKFKEDIDKKVQKITPSITAIKEQETEGGSFEEEVLKAQRLLEKLENNSRKEMKSKIREAIRLINELKRDVKEETKKQEKFEIKVKDRQIWVNNYFLSKPFAIGKNYDFFQYIRSLPAGTKISREELPIKGAYSYLKNDIKNKTFTKMLNELGFKGEILKAFFPQRSKNTLVYRGDKITKTDLEKSGVKIAVFLKELELAHIKNNPE